MTTPRLALLSFTAGASLACGWMVALAARTAWTITRTGRWADVHRLI